MGLFNLNFDRLRLDGRPLALLGLTLLGTAAGLTPLLIARTLTARATPERRRPGLTALVWAISGVVRAGAVIWAGRVYDLVPDDEIPKRIAGAMFGTALALAVGEALTTRFEQLLAHSRELELASVELRQQIEVTGQQAERDRAQLVAQTQAVLETELSQIEQRASSNDTALVAELQRVAEEVVRPLSHSIADARVSQAPETSPSQTPRLGRYLAHRVPASQLIRPGWTVCFVALFRLAALLVAGQSFIAVLPSLVASWLTLAVVSVLIRRLRIPLSLAVAVSLGSAALAGAVGTMVETVLFHAHSATQLWSYTAGLLVVSGVLTAVETVDLMLRSQLTEQEQLNRSLEERGHRARQEIWLNRKRVASILHGPVQAALQASSIRLAQLSPGDIRASQRILEDLRQTLATLEAPVATSAADVMNALDGLELLWAEQCAVSGQISPKALRAFEHDPSLCQALIELMNEAVLNAVKHASARRIRVAIDRGPTGIVLTVWNDGLPAPEQSPAGYGSQLLNELCREWSLRPTATGTELRAVLASEPTTEVSHSDDH